MPAVPPISMATPMDLSPEPANFYTKNKNTPLWTRKSEDVTNVDYASYYKPLSNDGKDHPAMKHFSVEGQREFRALLFAPRRAFFDLFESEKKRNNIKPDVRRVSIIDDYNEPIPDWLNLVKGVVDSEDLPQDRKFYEHFGESSKLGVHEESTNQTKVAELLRYQTSKSGDEQISLRDHVDRMKEGRIDIRYIAGENFAAVPPSPFLENFRKKGVEALHLVDPIDEYGVQQLKEFDGKQLKSTEVAEHN